MDPDPRDARARAHTIASTTDMEQDFVDQIELAMSRIYDPSVSNQEKQSIAQQLEHFKNTNIEFGLVQCYHMLTLRFV